MRRADCAEDGAGVGVGVTLPDRGTASAKALGGKQVCLFCFRHSKEAKKGEGSRWRSQMN